LFWQAEQPKSLSHQRHFDIRYFDTPAECVSLPGGSGFAGVPDVAFSGQEYSALQHTGTSFFAGTFNTQLATLSSVRTAVTARITSLLDTSRVLHRMAFLLLASVPAERFSMCHRFR
jgi:hypothetical protein